MAKLIIAKDIQLGGKIYVQDELLTSVSFKKTLKLDSLPTLYDKEFQYVEVANQWFAYLKSSKRLEDLNSYSKAILRYWNFLENNQFICVLPASGSAGPNANFLMLSVSI
jgi:uncharacterized ferritin-like protein (DUF455 family)